MFMDLHMLVYVIFNVFVKVQNFKTAPLILLVQVARSQVVLLEMDKMSQMSVDKSEESPVIISSFNMDSRPIGIQNHIWAHSVGSAINSKSCDKSSKVRSDHSKLKRIRKKILHQRHKIKKKIRKRKMHKLRHKQKKREKKRQKHIQKQIHKWKKKQKRREKKLLEMQNNQLAQTTDTMILSAPFLIQPNLPAPYPYTPQFLQTPIINISESNDSIKSNENTTDSTEKSIEGNISTVSTDKSSVSTISTVSIKASSQTQASTQSTKNSNSTVKTTKKSRRTGENIIRDTLEKSVLPLQSVDGSPVLYLVNTSAFLIKYKDLPQDTTVTDSSDPLIRVKQEKKNRHRNEFNKHTRTTQPRHTQQYIQTISNEQSRGASFEAATTILYSEDYDDYKNINPNINELEKLQIRGMFRGRKHFNNIRHFNFHRHKHTRNVLNKENNNLKAYESDYATQKIAQHYKMRQPKPFSDSMVGFQFLAGMQEIE